MQSPRCFSLPGHPCLAPCLLLLMLSERNLHVELQVLGSPHCPGGPVAAHTAMLPAAVRPRSGSAAALGHPRCSLAFCSAETPRNPSRPNAESLIPRASRCLRPRWLQQLGSLSETQSSAQWGQQDLEQDCAARGEAAAADGGVPPSPALGGTLGGKKKKKKEQKALA